MIYFLTEFYFIGIILFCMVQGSRYREQFGERFAAEWTLDTIIISLSLVPATLLAISPFTDLSLFSDLIVLNRSTTLCKIVTSIFVLILLISFKQNRTPIRYFEYPIIILFSVVSMFISISANDFIVLFISLEIQSFCFYMLAAFQRNDVTSIEGGIKYFILGAFASVLFLIGITLIYSCTGSTNYTDIMKFTFYSLGDKKFAAGMIFVLSTMLFKLPVAPFHSWAPDVYSGTPIFIVSYLIVIPKLVIVTIFIKLLSTPFIFFNDFWQPFFEICAIVSFFVGAFGGIANMYNDIRKIFAYSSIFNAGFIVLGFVPGTSLGFSSVIFYVIVYMLINTIIFLTLIPLVGKIKVSDLTNIYRVNPRFAIHLSIGLFSLAGLPPLSGFFSKFYLLYSCMNHLSVLVLLFAVLFSTLACFIYIPMITKSFSFSSFTDYLLYRPKQFAILLILSSIDLSFFYFAPPLFDLCMNIWGG